MATPTQAAGYGGLIHFVSDNVTFVIDSSKEWAMYGFDKISKKALENLPDFFPTSSPKKLSIHFNGFDSYSTVLLAGGVAALGLGGKDLLDDSDEQRGYLLCAGGVMLLAAGLFQCTSVR